MFLGFASPSGSAFNKNGHVNKNKSRNAGAFEHWFQTQWDENHFATHMGSIYSAIKATLP